MEKYNYTQNWFLKSEIKNVLLKLVDHNLKYNILEIGCFEGLSACFFSDNLLDNIQSSLVCVDPFYKSGTVKGITSKYVDEKTKTRFLENTRKSKNSDKITFNNMTSDDFFKINTNTFNFIYLDGCHEPDYVARDVENSFKFLEKGGILWIDDYLCRSNGVNKIKNTIDIFLSKYKSQYKIIHNGYQIALKKY